eukprot:m.83469 g.83469  ORF g.83469 m.83469 type:complete len:205 (+) comp50815_c0_seq1:84-698(+)
MAAVEQTSETWKAAGLCAATALCSMDERCSPWLVTIAAAVGFLVLVLWFRRKYTIVDRGGHAAGRRGDAQRFEDLQAKIRGLEEADRRHTLALQRLRDHFETSLHVLARTRDETQLANDRLRTLQTRYDDTEATIGELLLVAPAEELTWRALFRFEGLRRKCYRFLLILLSRVAPTNTQRQFIRHQLEPSASTDDFDSRTPQDG